MQFIIQMGSQAQNILDKSKSLDFLVLLCLRLFLAPIMIIAGLGKLTNLESTAAWFEQSLHLPFPELMAFLAASTEFFGGIALLIGFATRWVSLPLMFTMLVAAFSVHWSNGWFAITPTQPQTSPAYVLEMVGFPGAKESLDNSESVAIRLNKAKEILKEHGNYEWLTERGGFVILNGGIEFAATYFLMLLTLFFYGGGAYLSADYWIAKKFRKKE
jgi:putative oxidoreductase